jgi:hypothetical protein
MTRKQDSAGRTTKKEFPFSKAGGGINLLRAASSTQKTVFQ